MAFSEAVHGRVITTTKDVRVVLDGAITWIVLDVEGRSVNVLYPGLVSQFEHVLDTVEKLVQEGKTQVVALVSDKDKTFIAGADIDALYPMTSAKEARDLSTAGQRLMQRVENLKAATVAVIDGPALGGGLELALACSHRICSDASWTQLGLPEVKLGLIPGSGGTWRLPRLIGIQQALPLLLTGSPVRPSKARALGLVDRILESRDRFEGEHRFWKSARQFCTQHLGPWKAPLPPTRSWSAYLMEHTWPGRKLMESTVRKGLDQQTRGKYPAPYALLDVLLHSNGQEDAMRRESSAFGRLAVTSECKSLMSLFYMVERSKKVENVLGTAASCTVSSIGVIGAGVMGSQIAILAANKGFRVFMRDINHDVVQRGLDSISSFFMARVARKRMSLAEAERRIQRVTGSTSLDGFRECDLVIEAAVERMDLKKKILKEVESIMPHHAVLASNTSSLSISEMAGACRRPASVVGMHFFNPVAKMPLIEVIQGTATSNDAAALVYQVSLRLGKIPIVCKDAPGFIVNRILGIYMNEAGHLLMEGSSMEDIDAALLDFGMLMGPFRLMDEVGLDVAAHVSPILEQGLGKRFAQAPEFARVLESTLPQFLGKKNGRGLYLYENQKSIGINRAMMALLDEARSHRTHRTASCSEIQDRCILVALQEAVRILEEGIVASPQDLDLSMIMGTGFAPFRGGLLYYADSRGISNIVSRLSQLQSHGLRFEPHPLLCQMAQSKQRFFPQRPVAVQQSRPKL